MYSDAKCLKQDLLPLMKQYGARLYLSGHEHFQAIHSDDSVVQVISGVAADPRAAITFKPHDNQVWGNTGMETNGFVKAIVHSDKIEMHIKSSKSLRDHASFQIPRESFSRASVFSKFTGWDQNASSIQTPSRAEATAFLIALLFSLIDLALVLYPHRSPILSRRKNSFSLLKSLDAPNDI